MIGREGQVEPFALIRWARGQAREHDLRPLEAHVLLLLATYANRDAIAWPRIATLALDVGLTVKRRQRRDPRSGRIRSSEGNSAISAALARLEELQLIWRKQAGRGRAVRIELLFNPSAQAEGNTATKPSAVAEGKQPQARPPEIRLPSASAEPALRERGGRSTRNGQNGNPNPDFNGERPDDALRQGGGRAAVRRIIREELGVPA